MPKRIIFIKNPTEQNYEISFTDPSLKPKTKKQNLFKRLFNKIFKKAGK